MATFNTGPVTPGAGNIGRPTTNPVFATPAPTSSMSSAPPPSFPQQSGGGNGNFFTNMSPEGQGALINTGTQLLGGYLSQRNAANQQNTQNQFGAEQAELARQADFEKLKMQLEQSRILQEKQMALQASQAAPERQNWRQQQALMSAILPELRNYQVQAPQGLERYVPQMSGGFRIPEGGFSPDQLAAFSPQARLSAEQDFDKQAARSSGGQAVTPNYSAQYGAQLGGPAAQDVNSYTQSILEQILKPQPTVGGQSPASPFQVAPRHPQQPM